MKQSLGTEQITIAVRRMPKSMKFKTLFALALTTSLAPLTLPAEEGGSGHYLPGAMASFIDALPGREAFAYVNAVTYYNGSASGSRRLNPGGQVVANINGTVYADSSTLLYQTSWKILGGQYAAAVTIPYVSMTVDGDVQIGPITGKRRGTASGLGDIEVQPLMLGWTNGDLKFGATFGVYVPTGEYEKGALANVGKNYWTFEPGLSVSWLSSRIGTEVSLFAGYDSSTKDKLTDYQSGDVFHLDATLAQHLPLFGGSIGVGQMPFTTSRSAPIPAAEPASAAWKAAPSALARCCLTQPGSAEPGRRILWPNSNGCPNLTFNIASRAT